MIKLLPPRANSMDRRRQLVAATLRLLARTPIESLSTRQLASELGLSQPALFRHFRNREALMLAVVDEARDKLETIAVEILANGRDAVFQLRALGAALLENAEREPGLPRLLFSSATPSAGKVRDALHHIVSMQESLVAELVKQGQRDGSIDVHLNPKVAATLFIGMIQGLVLHWEITARRESLVPQFGPLFDMWLCGVEAGAPDRNSKHGIDAAPATVSAPAPSPLVALDVRPLIREGVDPLAKILETLDVLPRGGVLVLEAPFRPAPLLALLAQRGHTANTEEIGTKHWLIEIVNHGQPMIDDLRHLEPPEPLERVLKACTTLSPGDVYLARLPRFPRMLLPHLQKRNLRFDVLERPDGAALLRVGKKT